MEDQLNILEAIAKGDRQAFGQLYADYSDKVYNTAISYLHNEANAEEVTQDVFTSIFRNAAQFKGQSAVSTWIYRITINTSLNHLKRKKRFSFIGLNSLTREPSHFEHPGVILENKENAVALFQAIASLPQHQQTAFILSFVEELPRQEVADIMETSLKAVESLLQRAKGNLRKKLESLYPNRRKR